MLVTHCRRILAFTSTQDILERKIYGKGMNTNTNTNTNTFILEIYTYIHEIFSKYIHDMAMKRKFMMYAPGNRNYGYCRLHFGYQIIIYIYIYITSLIETSRLMLIKIK